MIKSFKYYHSRFGMQGVITLWKSKFTSATTLLKVDRRDIRFPFYLRIATSDIPTFNQVFISKEYDFDLKSMPEVIVDAGANVGLASIYFANRYPDSKIIAIEPEKSNYEMLKSNVAAYSNIIPLHAALWDKNETINLVDPGLGNWGFMTEGSETDGKQDNISHEVKGMTVDKIMLDHNIERIDVLKIDIEGAEREVFINSSAWIEKVDSLIVELHERMKTGCNRSFYNGSNGFDVEWMKGENVYLSRKDSRTCMRPV